MILGRTRRRLAKAISNVLDPLPSEAGPGGVLLSGSILVHDNFLDTEEFIALQRWAFSVETPFTRKDRHWGEQLARDFHENKGSRQWASDHSDVPDVLRNFIERLREKGIVRQSDLIHFGVYRWERLSGMGVHNDQHTNMAMTFHLNDAWPRDWGGDFTYYETSRDLDVGIGRSIAPAANRLVVNHSTIDHKVSYCSTTAQDRVTLQAFVYKGKSR